MLRSWSSGDDPAIALPSISSREVRRDLQNGIHDARTRTCSTDTTPRNLSRACFAKTLGGWATMAAGYDILAHLGRVFTRQWE
jgi:hypothetical protein